MTVDAGALKTALEAAYPDATLVSTVDISGGCGASFEVIIVSPSFEKKSTLARHRQVNSKIATEIALLHAFSQKTYTPAEYEKLTNKKTEA